MPHYLIAQIKIHDPEEYQRYLDGFDEVFNQYNGTVLVVDDNTVVLEGTWPLPRTVVIRFDSEADFYAWYNSPIYRELMKHRQNASEGNIVLVKGKEEF
jgi:uncharacterized protein (DUF1330 family)